MDIQRGLTPKVERFIRNVERRLENDDVESKELLPVLQFIARNHPPTWMLLADFHERRGELEAAKEGVRRFVETALALDDRRRGWRRLQSLASRNGDPLEEIQACVEIISTPGSPMQELSDAASQINHVLYERNIEIDQYEKEMMIRRAANAFQGRIGDADAKDCSRLAWLYLHLQEETRAIDVVERGLTLDPHNDHLHGLAEKLNITMR